MKTSYRGSNKAAFYNSTRNRKDRIVGAVLAACSVNPVLSGAVTVGATLTVTTGTWSGSPTFTSSFFRDDVPIAGKQTQTTFTYVIVAADQGKNISASIQATTGAGTVNALSNQLAVP